MRNPHHPSAKLRSGEFNANSTRGKHIKKKMRPKRHILF